MIMRATGWNQTETPARFNSSRNTKNITIGVTKLKLQLKYVHLCCSFLCLTPSVRPDPWKKCSYILPPPSFQDIRYEMTKLPSDDWLARSRYLLERNSSGFDSHSFQPLGSHWPAVASSHLTSPLGPRLGLNWTFYREKQPGFTGPGSRWKRSGEGTSRDFCDEKIVDL